MPEYIGKGVERMVDPLGERLEKMEQQQKKLAARCNSLSSDIAQSTGHTKCADTQMEDLGKQVGERFDTIADAIAALRVKRSPPAAATGGAPLAEAPRLLPTTSSARRVMWDRVVEVHT